MLLPAGSTWEQDFVRQVIELHDKYMQYVVECFANSSLFHKALKEAFESFCNKQVVNNTSAELMANFCDNLLKKVGLSVQLPFSVDGLGVGHKGPGAGAAAQVRPQRPVRMAAALPVCTAEQLPVARVAPTALCLSGGDAKPPAATTGHVLCTAAYFSKACNDRIQTLYRGVEQAKQPRSSCVAHQKSPCFARHVRGVVVSTQ